ncbi:Non-specific serine/threonine protein kinase [Bertholletia excelsa]
MASIPSFLSFLVLSSAFFAYSAAHKKTNEDACPTSSHCKPPLELNISLNKTTSLECVFWPVYCRDSHEPLDKNHSQPTKWCRVKKCHRHHNEDNPTSPGPLLGHLVSSKSCRLFNHHKLYRVDDHHPNTHSFPRPLLGDHRFDERHPTKFPMFPPQLALFKCHNNSNEVNSSGDCSAYIYKYPLRNHIHNHLHSPLIVPLFNLITITVIPRGQETQDLVEFGDCLYSLKIFIAGVLLLFIIFCLLLWRCKNWKSVPSPVFSRNTSSDLPSRPVGESSFYFGTPVFTYSELEEATNNFHTSHELGDGGFGTVYHGKLQDGREVAVKRLHERNCRRISQFLNEIQILSRLRHPNLVSLYGCTSRRSRELLLVYEYIPNGTVADHLHGDRANSGSLTWPIRMNIAIETASALAYLRASEVIHLDVKTTNLLLDHDFCVKVADFGLARLFPFNTSHVSTAPQGTPGYVDPEYYQLYRLTDKSDVYSFGVVLVELLSSRPAVDMGRQKHEISLVNFAMSRIQNHAVNELIDPGLGFGSDTSVERMTASVAEVAFRCLQPEGEMRPTMDEALEALKQIREYRETETPPHEGDVRVVEGAP